MYTLFCKTVYHELLAVLMLIYVVVFKGSVQVSHQNDEQLPFGGFTSHNCLDVYVDQAKGKQPV